METSRFWNNILDKINSNFSRNKDEDFFLLFIFYSKYFLRFFYSTQSAIKIFVSLVPPLFLFDENTIR